MKKIILFSALGLVFIITFVIGLTVQNPSVATLPINDVVLNEEYIVLQVGQSDVLLASVYPFNANNQTLIWDSTDPNVVHVENGVIYGTHTGNVQVMVSSQDGQHSDYCYVDVVEE